MSMQYILKRNYVFDFLFDLNNFKKKWAILKILLPVECYVIMSDTIPNQTKDPHNRSRGQKAGSQ